MTESSLPDRSSSLILPEPDADSRARSLRLLAKIQDAIKAHGGSIGFDQYMRMALYDPVLGYYHAPGWIFGAGGDFVTAPEVSPVLAWRLARLCAQAFDVIKGGEILEFGAGSGALAAELLLELGRLGALPRRYCVLELSAELRRRQRECLQARAPHLLPRVAWLNALPPPGFEGVIVANEVLDAMPVQCFALRGGAIVERRVTAVRDPALAWYGQAADADLGARVSAVLESLPEPLPDDYYSELNPALGAWMRTLAERLSQALLLIIDYGYPRREYYHPQRHTGTLLCHYQHRAHDDPFFYPGLQDISANVDFTALAEAARAARLELLAYTTQAQFLLAAGLDEIFARAADEREHLHLSQQLQRLTLPGEMGDRFQLMALGRDLELPAQAFTNRDQRVRL